MEDLAAVPSERPPMRVLIVDDNVAFLDVATKVLEQDGLTVVGVATSGREAMERVRELRPDVMLVDVDLGEESGFVVAQEVADAVGVPVVLISAYPKADFVDLVAESPAIGFVSKTQLSASALSELVQDLGPGGRTQGS
jgi:CheY-like chemotaxis protein